MTSRRVIAALFILAIVRVVSTYTVFSHTADEPAHVAAGMEILVQHRYTLHLENTPMPRVVLMLLPWLSGADYRTDGTVVERGNSTIYSHGQYRTNLVRIRVGNLVFFLIAIAFTYLWARRSMGVEAAIASLFFFTTQPVILGFAGLATTDMAAVAGLAVALYAFWWWLESPTAANAILAGAAFGFAIDCKQSSLTFVPVAAFAMWIVRVVQHRAPALRTIAHLPLMFIASVPVWWGGYAFDVGSMNAVEPVPAALVPAWLANMPVLAPKLFRGTLKLVEVDRHGHPSYLFGMGSLHGWWWYFPAALLLKSTLASLGAVVIAIAARLRAAAEAAAAALAILMFVMTTHIDVGIRYALPVFVPLSLVAGAALVALWPKRRAVAIGLVAWQLLTGLSHPDSFAYFNEIAGRDPSRYLLDSNLDWGQDLLRLQRELKRRNVRQLGLKFFGPEDLAKHSLPPWTELRMDQPSKGWVAISENWYHGIWYDGYHAHRYPWLESQKPVARIGKSIRLYFIR